jgi:hypothetical protein
MGLVFFVAIASMSPIDSQAAARRYVWWSSIRLNSDPLNKHPHVVAPCSAGPENCAEWDVRDIWIDPGWIEKGFKLSVFPALAVGTVIVSGLSRLGVSEVLTFMVTVPMLIFAWYYFLGWMIDRWILKRTRQT